MGLHYNEIIVYISGMEAAEKLKGDESKMPNEAMFAGLNGQSFTANEDGKQVWDKGVVTFLLHTGLIGP